MAGAALGEDAYGTKERTAWCSRGEKISGMRYCVHVCGPISSHYKSIIINTLLLSSIMCSPRFFPSLCTIIAKPGIKVYRQSVMDAFFPPEVKVAY